MLRAIRDAVEVPIMASGGAGDPEHLYEAFTDGGADAVLAASIFHFGKYDIPFLKHYLHEFEFMIENKGRSIVDSNVDNTTDAAA